MALTIQDVLRKPFFRMILKEWGLHVKTKQDPTMFANIYLEWMRDPVDHGARQAVMVFVNFMRPREWPALLEFMGPYLDLEVAEVFKMENAADFYHGFRGIVVQAIQDYWSQFIATQEVKKNGDEIGPRDWSPRAGYCVCKRPPWECRCEKPFQ